MYFLSSSCCLLGKWNRFYIKNDNNWMMNDKIDELNNNDNYDESLG